MPSGQRMRASARSRLRVDGTIAYVIELPEGSWWDWDVLHFDGRQLRLVAAGSVEVVRALVYRLLA